MPKLTAGAAMAGAIIMASATGNRYQIDENCQVDVDQRDVAHLLKAGFSLGDEPAAPPAPLVSTFAQDASPGEAQAAEFVAPISDGA